MTICSTFMVQGGGLSTGKSGFTINTRGRLDCATFVLHGGRRRGSSSSGLLHGEVSGWWRAYGRDGRGWGRTMAGGAAEGRAVHC